MPAYSSYQVPHLLGVVNYSEAKGLKPDGNMIRRFGPVLSVRDQCDSTFAR